MQAKVHPAADVFPMMNAEQYERLKEDIAAHGQQEAIVYWRGQLVDGRNRFKACRELKVEPTECELDESIDPVAYVISANLHRRHLVTSQRSLVAAKLATLGNGQRKDGARSNDLAQADAAALLQVSEPSVKRAKHVIANGSKELVQAVELGDVNLNQALKLTKAVEDKREQSKIVREGKAAIKAAITPPETEQESNDDEDEHDYDYPIVKAFEHCDYRINTLRRLVTMLEPHEKIVLADLLKDQG